MMSDNELSIGVAVLKSSVPTEGTLKERMLVTMKAAQEPNVLWFLYDSKGEEAFRCAVGAVMMVVGPEEQEQIKVELGLLRGLSAAMSGVPVDFAAMTEGIDPEKAIGLQGLWQEATSSREPQAGGSEG